MANNNGNFIENIAFLEQAKSSALGLVTSKKGVNFNEADLLLNQLEGTINREKQTLKAKISNELEDNSIKAQYQVQDMKEIEKDVDTQIGFLLDERAININKEIEKRKNDSIIKRGYTLTPDELDNTMLELTEDYMNGVPENKKGQFKQTLNKIYGSHKQEIDNNYVKMVRENAQQVAQEHISNIPTLYDISNPDTLRNVVNQTSKKFQGVFDSNTAKNRQEIENSIVSSLSNLIKPENTKEQNDKIYNSMKTYLTTQNGSVIPGNINPKLGEVIDTKYKVILNQAKDNEESQNKLFQIGLDNTLDNLVVDENTHSTLLNIDSVISNQKNKINNSQYLNTLEKQEYLKNIEKKEKSLVNYKDVYTKSLNENLAISDELEKDKKDIVMKRYNNETIKLLQEEKFGEIADTISKTTKIPDVLSKQFEKINSNDVKYIGEAMTYIEQLSNNNKNVLNNLDKDVKSKYYFYKAQLSFNSNITPINDLKKLQLKEDKEQKQENSFENINIDIDGESYNPLNYLSQKEYVEEKEKFDTYKLAIGYEGAKQAIQMEHKDLFGFVEIGDKNIRIQNNKIDKELTSLSIDYYYTKNNIDKKKLDEHTFVLKDNNLLAIPFKTFIDANGNTTRIQAENVYNDKLSIKNFKKLSQNILQKKTNNELKDYLDIKEKEQLEMQILNGSI